jgi:hypothetical protein
MWDWWAVDTEGFLVRFSGGPAPEHLLAHVERVDAEAAWAEGHRPAWFDRGSLTDSGEGGVGILSAW